MPLFNGIWLAAFWAFPWLCGWSAQHERWGMSASNLERNVRDRLVLVGVLALVIGVASLLENIFTGGIDSARFSRVTLGTLGLGGLALASWFILVPGWFRFFAEMHATGDEAAGPHP